MLRRLKIALVLGLTLASAGAEAATLRYAAPSDVATLDPHAINETFTLGVLGNIYEGLVRRNAELELEPSLATDWERVEPTRWRFHLRPNVVFHAGGRFDADDVIYSAERLRMPGSGLASRLSGVVAIEKVDPLTVDFVTAEPDPLLPSEWDTWYILDREWMLEPASAGAEPANAPTTRPLDMQANGTGPYRLLRYEAGTLLQAERFTGWWGRFDNNVERVEFRPIASDATRLAALLTDGVDLVQTLPLRDIARVEREPDLRVEVGAELRTIFLGFDHARPILVDRSAPNPLRDRRVRLAFALAIDTGLIGEKIMRGHAEPATSLVAPPIDGFPGELAPYGVDLERARTLLAEAGWPNGFELTLDCPNDRYINDAAICEAVAAMLARIGVDIDLQAKPKALYFAKVLEPGGYATSFYLLGFTPGNFDSSSALVNLVHSRSNGDGLGTYNLGNYSNPEVDRLIEAIDRLEIGAERDHLVEQAWRIVHDDVAYVPLHQQPLVWAMRSEFSVVMRADNQLLWRWVRRKDGAT